jgi:tetratricopeptide (TPR) repeat protein
MEHKMMGSFAPDQLVSDALIARLRKPGPIGRIMDALYGYDIFLSYARADDPDSVFATTLKSLLDENIDGHKPVRCFLDAGDMPHDETLTRALTVKIRASHTLVVLAGPTCLNHRWVNFEVQTALHFNRRVIVLDRGIDWPNCQGLLKDLLPEHIQINCEGVTRPTEHDVGMICEQIGWRRVESRRKRVWRTVLAVLSSFLIVTLALLVRQVDLTEAERVARADAEENFRLAKRSVDENFTIVEYDLKDVPGVGKYRLKLLTKARDFYREFIAKRKSDELELEYAKALYNLGLIELELGGDAGSSFEMAWDFLKQAAFDQPSNFEMQQLLFMSGSSTGIAYITRKLYKEAERKLRGAIQLGGLLREERPHDRKLHMDYWLAHFALGRAIANQSKAEEAQQVFEQALEGMQLVRQELGRDPDSKEKSSLLRYVTEYVAGAYFNLANTATVSLERRIEAARNSWWRYETLLSQNPTDNQLFFRTAQACRLMAMTIFEFGDAGEAQIFAERSLLIHYSLSKHYSDNKQFTAEFERDLNFLKKLPAWSRKLWFHEAALEALSSVYETGAGAPEEQRQLAHRIALAHVEIAVRKIRNAIIAASPPPTTDNKLQAHEHLIKAKSINNDIQAGRWNDDVPDSVRVMKLNIPMLLDFTR